MRYKYISYILFLFFIGCTSYKPSAEKNLIDIIDTYLFLSDNHDLLHIMMGEYEGSPVEAYKDFSDKLSIIDNNQFIQPIKNSFKRIVITKSKLKYAEDFDKLVDYYQSSLELQINGILMGYGINSNPIKRIDYTNISNQLSGGKKIYQLPSN